jgi:hypothetical protein
MPSNAPEPPKHHSADAVKVNMEYQVMTLLSGNFVGGIA